MKSASNNSARTCTPIFANRVIRQLWAQTLFMQTCSMRGIRGFSLFEVLCIHVCAATENASSRGIEDGIKSPGKKKRKKREGKDWESRERCGMFMGHDFNLRPLEGGRCCSSILKKRSSATRKLYYTLCCFLHQRFASRLLRLTTGPDRIYIYVDDDYVEIPDSWHGYACSSPSIKHTKCSLILRMFISITNSCRWIRSQFFS